MDCISGDSACANHPSALGTYGEYAGYLCGPCADREERRRNEAWCEQRCDWDECGEHDPASCTHVHAPLGVHAA